jgi:hypothetical protein
LVGLCCFAVVSGLLILGLLGGGLTLGLYALDKVLSDGAIARRELVGLPPRRVAELRPGPARVTGRVVPVGPPLVAPLSGQPCVFYQLQTRSREDPTQGKLRRGHVHYPPAGVVFEIDDGTGRAMVRVPPPAPKPEPGDDLAWEVVCFIRGAGLGKVIGRGESAALDRLEEMSLFGLSGVERILSAGDLVTVGGVAFEEIASDGQSASHRAPPTRQVLTATQNVRLAIVKS